MKLFDPPGWIGLFLSVLLVSIIFIISARIGTSHLKIQTFNREIIFFPFRQMFDPQLNTHTIIRFYSNNPKIENLRSIIEIKSSISESSTIL